MSGKWLIRLIYVFVFADPEPAIINIPHGWLEICGKFGLYSNCNIIKVNRFYAMLLYCYTQYHLFTYYFARLHTRSLLIQSAYVSIEYIECMVL